MSKKEGCSSQRFIALYEIIPTAGCFYLMYIICLIFLTLGSVMASGFHLAAHTNAFLLHCKPSVPHEPTGLPLGLASHLTLKAHSEKLPAGRPVPREVWGKHREEPCSPPGLGPGSTLGPSEGRGQDHSIGFEDAH